VGYSGERQVNVRLAYLFLTIAIAAGGATLQVTVPAELPSGTQYEPYHAVLTASGGTPPYTWSLAAGTVATLPEGTSFNQTASTIEGVPKGSGVYAVTLQVTDSARQSAAAAVAIPIFGNQHLNGCTFFPADNVWRQRIDGLPVHRLSSVWNSTSHNARFHPDFGPSFGIPFTTVDAGQPLQTVTIDGYAQESDFGVNSPGPAQVPIPPDAPIEGTDAYSPDGDRHVLTIDTSTCVLYELYNSHLPAWTAMSSARFDLKSNALRPDTWTSADAAGLPIVPGLVSFDEVQSGEIAHALRMTIQHTNDSYLWPARHEAGLSGQQLPPMGARIRLRNSSSVNARIARLSPANRVIGVALQRFGAFVADNGGSGYVSGVPDARWDGDDLTNLFASPVVAVSLPTSTDASAGSTLTFGGLTGVRVGMWVQCHTTCKGIGVDGSTSANPVVAAIQGGSIELSQPLLAAVPQGTVIDFVDPDSACNAGPGFCLNDFDYVDESALQVDANSGATRPVITTPALPGAIPGASYSASITFTGGLPPFTCSVASGALPSGLHLDPAACTIMGSFSDVSGRFFRVAVTDSAGRSGSAWFTVRYQNRRIPPSVQQ
jgi:hypothetical protein